jgi:outer membrane lipoprotein-sorting protein
VIAWFRVTKFVISRGMSRRLVLVGCGFLAATLLVAASAHAYLLPASFLIKQMAERRAKADVRDCIVQLSAEIDGQDQPLDERIYMKNPERFRLERDIGEQNWVVVEREGKRAEGMDGKLTASHAASTEMLSNLIMPKGHEPEDMAARTIAMLQGMGVETKVVSITIYGKDARETAYIIGAKPGDTEKPQLWVDSSTFLPVRLVTFVDEGGKKTRYESRFFDYTTGVGDFFPRVIENYKAGKLIRRAEVNDIKVNQDLPDTLFQVPAS